MNTTEQGQHRTSGGKHAPTRYTKHTTKKKISTTGSNQYNTRRLKPIKSNKKTKIITKKIKEKQQNGLKTIATARKETTRLKRCTG